MELQVGTEVKTELVSVGWFSLLGCGVVQDGGPAVGVCVVVLLVNQDSSSFSCPESDFLVVCVVVI